MPRPAYDNGRPSHERAVVPQRTIALDADLVRLAGDGNTALFLRQCLFWWQALGRRPFYKFNAPAPNQSAYRPGDSWLEELGLSRSQFETARKRVAVKVAGKDLAQIEAALAAGALVVYWTEEDHKTWYLLNEAHLRALAPERAARWLGEEEPGAAGGTACPDGAEEALPGMGAPTQPDPRWPKPNKESQRVRPGSLSECDEVPWPHAPPGVDTEARQPICPPEGEEREPGRCSAPATPSERLGEGGGLDGSAYQSGPALFLPDAACQRPDVTFPPPECRMPASPDVAPPHSLMPDPRIGIIRNTEIALQTRSTKSTQIPPTLPPTAPVRAGQEEEGQVDQRTGLQTQMQQALEARAVFPDPARLIAARAVRQGLTVAEVVELFEAHLRQAEREQARNPLGAVVWRLQQQPLRRPRCSGRYAAQEEVRAFLATPPLEPGGEQEHETWPDTGAVEETDAPAAPTPDPADELRRLWRTVLYDLHLQMTRTTFEQWLKVTELEREEAGVYVVSTPNPYAIDWLEHRLGRLIRQTLQRHVGEGVQVRYVVQQRVFSSDR